MCGIFAVVSSKPIPNVNSVIHSLVRANLSRGARGIGLLCIQEGGAVSIYKTADVDLTRGEYPVEEADKITAVLGHLLAPTNGDDIDAKRIHPVSDASGRFLLAHNGILTDYEGSWDSQWLVEQMAIRGPSALEYVRGQHACWMYDRQYGNMFIWRCMSPLYYARNLDTDTFYVSSVNPKLNELLFLRLLPGQLFKAQINPLKRIQTSAGNDGYLKNVSSFTCVSPYTES